ncbi:MAG: hypothetical protein ABIH11_07770 [Candidatus Altiarchaeota archaeon]
MFFCGCFEDPITSEAVKEKDPGLCLAQETDYKVDDCVRKVAKAAIDKRICDEYFKDDKENKAGCYKDVGGLSGDLDLCDQAGTMSGRDLDKWECYKNAGINNQQPAVCGRIGDADHKTSCYSALGVTMDNVDLCHEAAKAKEGFMSDSCFKNLADKNNNHALCQHIENAVSRDECYLRVAEKTGNPEVCLGMTEEYGHYCTGKITGNYDECEYAGGYKTACVKEAAGKSGRADICDTLEGYSKYECYTLVAGETGDDKICDKLDEGSRLSCLLGAGRKSGNPGVCSRVGDEKKEYCYSEIAVASGSVNICDRINEDKERYNCRRRVEGSITTTTIPYKDKSIIGKAKDKAGDIAADFIADIIGF